MGSTARMLSTIWAHWQRRELFRLCEDRTACRRRPSRARINVPPRAPRRAVFWPKIAARRRCWCWPRRLRGSSPPCHFARVERSCCRTRPFRNVLWRWPIRRGRWVLCARPPTYMAFVSPCFHAIVSATLRPVFLSFPFVSFCLSLPLCAFVSYSLSHSFLSFRPLISFCSLSPDFRFLLKSLFEIHNHGPKCSCDMPHQSRRRSRVSSIRQSFHGRRICCYRELRQ